MTCAACVRRVEQALKSIDGVTDVAVNLATARATITHGEIWDGIEAVRNVISDEGYEFLGVRDDTREDPITAARAKDPVCPVHGTGPEGKPAPGKTFRRIHGHLRR